MERKPKAVAPAKEEKRPSSPFRVFTDLYDRIARYLKSVKSEIKRVTWPSRQELRTATIVVAMTVVIVSMYMWVVDTILEKVFKLLK
ncbi:MAG: preprotein translocase subunit SecE [Armatimonadetes bacterium]|nr:preprotein translocase subunit SecE [Armatimonadota bacterium]